MLRREFVRLLAKITGGTMAATLAPPLLRINTALLAEAQAQCINPMTCGQQDCCTTQDNCGATDTVGHTCTTKDLCDIDASGDCTNDVCREDSSSRCQGDPGCTNDLCDVDKSRTCENDSCITDQSGACKNDQCQEDSSGYCEKDACTTDNSGACWNDQCEEDSSGACLTKDSCTSDQSGSCSTQDACVSDKSGACNIDTCETDSSGTCDTDWCLSDKSGACQNDRCQEDSSGACKTDVCIVDKSLGNWDAQTCPDDKTPAFDYCNSDYSGFCQVKDICVLDHSGPCAIDICREDQSSACTTDTCSQDLGLNVGRGRRDFARAGLNQAIKWLYHLSIILIVLFAASGTIRADTVIDSRNAVFSPTPTYIPGQAVTVANPVGPFLRDCDGDGILEADTNGDGQCPGDPKIIMMNNTGGATWGLPTGTAFTGNFEFTCFHISYRMAIASTGPLTIKASREVAVFGAMRLGGDTVISTPAAIDLRASAWLSDGAISFITAQAGEVDQSQTPYESDGHLPPIYYDSLCGRIDWGLFLPIILKGQ
jgi:hypothetical protein